LHGDIKGAAAQVAGYSPAGMLYNLGATIYHAGKGDKEAQGNLAGIGTQIVLGHIIVSGSGAPTADANTNTAAVTNAVHGTTDAAAANAVQGKVGANQSINYANYGSEFLDDGLRFEGQDGYLEARRMLNTALRRQGLTKPVNGLKQTWTEGAYDYQVRVHATQANAPAGSNSATSTTYIVSRRLQGVDANGQGNGWERLNPKDNKWYFEKDLKSGKFPSASNDTHIPLSQ